MSIIISDISYHYPNEIPLFSHLHLAISAQDKVSLIGNNGTGKSTLLKLISGDLLPVQGSIICPSQPYYIPQQIHHDDKTVAEALGVHEKLNALSAIINGSVSPADYTLLNDDWNIESGCEAALAYWQLPHINLTTPMNELSGGEKTKVFLAGCLIHKPDIILLDEPTNHLDYSARELLYDFICRSKAMMVVVSHDITLLNLLKPTYELSSKGITLYGGNYAFYEEQKIIEVNALNENISAEEKSLRLARKKAQEVKQRQDKRNSQGEKNKDQVIRILRKTVLNSGENTGAKLGEKHAEIIENNRQRLTELRQKKEVLFDLKIDIENTRLHQGKLLFSAHGINHQYEKEKPLWEKPLDFELYSGDRVHIQGKNGSGKTTLVNILTGELLPQEGNVQHAHFSYVYLDQQYSPVHVDMTVLELAQQYNSYSLADHEVKIRLNRALFPASDWDKKCSSLSGGEKLRLYLCCLMLTNHIPDLFILDEPTNNLDLAGLQILTQTIKNYKGSLLVISHDRHFVEEVRINRVFVLE